ncbi:MAG: dihydrolipoamide acetyltransferase family protein, partial [Dehalococcoidia bacterium]
KRKEAPEAETKPSPEIAGVEELPVDPVRRAIAQRMLQSAQQIPHAWTMMEADVSGLVARVGSAKEEFRRREGVNLTYLPFVIQAVVNALKAHPLANSTWTEDKIVLKKSVNIGIAVDREEGLIVPVIKDADQKSVAALANEVHKLAEKARQNKLSVQDVQDGTFTVNNTGALGAILSMPIINPPQAGIITSEAVVKRPVVIDDAIAIRSIMNLCLSFDHRILDGGAATAFLKSVKSGLEAIGPDMVIY